jgi:hypothetical protein
MSVPADHIIVDADVIVIDRVYKQDWRFDVNRRFLDVIQRKEILAGIPTQALFEIVGKLSFHTPPQDIPTLHEIILIKYGLFPVPSIRLDREYSQVELSEILSVMSRKVAFGDAVLIAQIQTFVPRASAFITWNSKHFVNKMNVPALTPAEWLANH